MRYSPFKSSLADQIKDARIHTLEATPDTVHWGYFDNSLEPALTVNSGDFVYVETVTHHAGDAPDLLMDEGIKKIYEEIPEETRKPGPHLMTGPIKVEGAEPGDMLEVQILDLEPRLPYGSNLSAPWGFLFDEEKYNGNEQVTIYEIDEKGKWLTPKFAYTYPGPYYVNGKILEPEETDRKQTLPNMQIPARLHIGTIAVAPAESGPVSTIPPSYFGGNIDNWRIGADTTMYYPVQNKGALLSLGDSHLAQGDSELNGTGVEASLNCLIRVKVRKDFSFSLPLLETNNHWMVHAFNPDLNEAAKIGSLSTIGFLQDFYNLSASDAYSFLAVAADFHITQVVNENKGIHVSIPKDAFRPEES
ncbi:acetamidase/formamidase family protein [Salipaludibacillus sp. CUR1]|uniref:acetamidase/formamidase family protein n=1 Tax=Salipaludibacillus sp. CUR1 TaxID=2820003 RepID=UPI001E35629E|nr:acetamidase/formamidase family protein [Salipaludibacillus sp. CUR1]MCE7790944.1 acetamidase/formamidase family protein [Salipaludibacillus sp. CUR1]